MYSTICESLKTEPKTWLVTGVAGFIGSNLLEALLRLNQKVVGLDNFSTGYQCNLDEVKRAVSSEQWENFTFRKGDVCNEQDCSNACKGVNYVLHQAALGSVPRSIANPLATNASNIMGFLNMLIAAKDAQVDSFTYAASSSTYGDHPALPKVEQNIGNPLSPYAVTKYVNELYAGVFSKTYDFNCIGLRYFNVFGKRQDPNGAYAAVIPKWASSIIHNDDVFINGDGETSRDFCYIDNAVQANILAATAKASSKNQVYNIAVGDRTTLNELFIAINSALNKNGVNYVKSVKHRDFRAGDVKHSQADITKASRKLGYKPTHDVFSGIIEAMPWYLKTLNKAKLTST